MKIYLQMLENFDSQKKKKINYRKVSKDIVNGVGNEDAVITADNVILFILHNL